MCSFAFYFEDSPFIIVVRAAVSCTEMHQIIENSVVLLNCNILNYEMMFQGREELMQSGIIPQISLRN